MPPQLTTVNSPSSIETPPLPGKPFDAVVYQQTTVTPGESLEEHLPPLEDQKRFERTVARHWCLRQALINGHSLLRPQAAQAQADLNALIADDVTSDRLAACLLQTLDSTTRTSSLIECINGLLKSFEPCRKWLMLNG